MAFSDLSHHIKDNVLLYFEQTCRLSINEVV